MCILTAINRLPLTSILVSIVLLTGHVSFCFGFVYIRHPCNVHPNRRHNIRLMAEQPQTPSTSASSSPEGTTIGKKSKRKRVASVYRRVSSCLASILNIQSASAQQAEISDPVQVETSSSEPVSVLEDIIQNQINELLQIEGVQSNNEEVEETTILTVSDDNNDSTKKSRQSKSADHVDLSGTWKPIVTEQFKKEYDSYLVKCNQSFIVRKVCVNGIQYQKETIHHKNNGVELEIIATNPAGNWNRTLVASDESQPINVTITDPDGDVVQVEAWWEDNGTKHKSLLQDKPRMEGGYFETVRYLESNDVLVCHSSFIPPEGSTKFKYGNVIWKFQRYE